MNVKLNFYMILKQRLTKYYRNEFYIQHFIGSTVTKQNKSKEDEWSMSTNVNEKIHIFVREQKHLFIIITLKIHMYNAILGGYFYYLHLNFLFFQHLCLLLFPTLSPLPWFSFFSGLFHSLSFSSFSQHVFIDECIETNSLTIHIDKY